MKNTFIATSLAAILGTSNIVFANDELAANKSAFYSQCHASCLESQIKAEENKSLLKYQFLLDAYCACYCAGSTIKLSPDDLSELALLTVENEGDKSALEKHERINGILANNSTVCMKAIFQ